MLGCTCSYGSAVPFVPEVGPASHPSICPGSGGWVPGDRARGPRGEGARSQGRFSIAGLPDPPVSAPSRGPALCPIPAGWAGKQTRQPTALLRWRSARAGARGAQRQTAALLRAAGGRPCLLLLALAAAPGAASRRATARCAGPPLTSPRPTVVLPGPPRFSLAPRLPLPSRPPENPRFPDGIMTQLPKPALPSCRRWHSRGPAPVLAGTTRHPGPGTPSPPLLPGRPPSALR